MHKALGNGVVRLLCLALFLLALSGTSFAQVSVGISVGFAPPPLPVYEQPICPEDGYIWTPGYWAWDGDDYFWVPGTWVAAPEVGFLWTPAWWGWGGSAFIFHEGYWGPHVGWYGGISYGFGYFGHGYEGGRWDGGHFFYNREFNNVNVTVIHNVYSTRIENTNANRVSYNGGTGGITARPSAQEEEYSRERHVPPVSAQTQHFEAARGNRELRASANQGKPPIAATSRPGDFKAATVPAREAGGPYKAPERTQSNARPGGETRPPANHASEVQPHKYTAPTTGNPEVDRKNQQAQEKLAAKQNQEHQKLQQQQEKEHQQAAQKNANEAQKQQMEQRHTQQTQQLEQKHAVQQQKVQARQQPRESAPREKH